MTLTLELIEGAINAVKDYLEDNIAAKLDVLDAEYQDFELENIMEWHMAELTAIPSYPAILVLGDSTEIPVEGDGWMKAVHTITIVCLASDQTPERLRKRLYRYVRACAELLKESRPTIGYAVVFDRLEFSPMYTKEGGFLSDSRLIIKLGRNET